MNFSDTELLAIKELLYKIADDQLIVGHRNSEWTGLGPILEEDIAFSSIAQDKIGQSFAIYNMLHNIGESDPDAIAFSRNAERFKCCQYVERPIGEYDFSLIRNFFFNHAESLRFEMLAESSFEPIAKLARKLKGEIKYHVMHADTWVIQLGNANEDSRSKLQNTINTSFDLALGIFEPGDYEETLISSKIFFGEKKLRGCWIEIIRPILSDASLLLPDEGNWNPVYGGRKGKHSEYLPPLIEEMAEVFRIDPGAEW